MNVCLKVKTETLLRGPAAPPGRSHKERGVCVCVCGIVGGRKSDVEEERWRQKQEEDGVIETEADEGRVERALSDKQEHGSSLQAPPGGQRGPVCRLIHTNALSVPLSDYRTRRRGVGVALRPGCRNTGKR